MRVVELLGASKVKISWLMLGFLGDEYRTREPGA